MVGKSALRSGFAHAAHRPELAWVAVLAAVCLALMAEGVAFALRGGRLFRRVLDVCARIPWARLRARIERLEAGAARGDGAVRRFFVAPQALLRSLGGVCLLGWLCEATETFLMLRAVGVALRWSDAVGIEALVVLTRHLLVLLPGGLGAVELGYSTLLAGAGADLSACAAFALLKRLRELGFVALGYALLAAARLKSASSREPSQLQAS